MEQLETMKLIENIRGLGTGNRGVGLMESSRRRNGEATDAPHNHNEEKTHICKAIEAFLESKAQRKEGHKPTSKKKRK